MRFKTDKRVIKFFFPYGKMNHQREQSNMQKEFLLQSKKLKKTEINHKIPKNHCCLPQRLSLLVICHLYGHWVQSLDSSREMMREANTGNRDKKENYAKVIPHLQWLPLTLNPFRNCEILRASISSILG